ncbi:MAG: T9SS type A sorting domain-containing protein [Candidatus Eisenbacteria bacterium]|uniref:T9SS type A sorting domain-containing protein n=1 Tax=Eiseniibacteriota bacterium TaxID=2212470 RepID=A0A933SFM9_UNCEI|nr:T9SS type A sorting domain-containing protein [Candidatus Eisenbacteria bacterium]
MRLLAVLTAFALAASAVPAHAGWGRTPVGTPVVTALADQHRPLAVPDGDGGAFLVFADLRAGGYDVYAQRINRAGNRVWSADGVPVCSASGLQDMPRLVADGAGGIVVTWEDHRGTSYDVYAQRLDGDGNRLWTPDGVLLGGANGDQVDPALVSDGAGGAIVAWTDFRGGATSDVYVQHVSGAGAPVLAPNGVILSAAAFDQDSPALASDGAGGAFVVWNDFRNGSNSDLYMAHLTAGGALPWGVGGVVLANGAGDQISASIAEATAGGALFVWTDTRAGNSDIYGQRINASGAKLWNANGLAVCDASNDQQFAVLQHDGADGMFVAWEDARSSNDNIFAHHLDSTGWPVWQVNGIAVCTAPGAQLEPQMVRDTAGGIILCWQDQRGANVDLYTQHVNFEGAPVWNGDGLPLCNAPAAQLYPSLVPDATGGAIAVWEDSRNLLVDLYAQRVLEDGTLGSSEPVITSITDVPNDNGGHVAITWQASVFEAPVPNVFQYRLWRRAPGGQWAAVDSAGPTLGAFYVRNGSTTADSTPGVTTPRTAFKVEAEAFDRTHSWWSAPDSGLSLDSQPPATPAGFLVLSLGNGQARAKWARSREADFWKYRMYFGQEWWFVPNEFTFRHTIVDTTWLGDIEPGWWIKLVAVDVHGNESDAAFALPEPSVGVEGGTPAMAFLGAASPNPMRETSTLRFGLSRESDVHMRVYDQQGRQVCVLASGRLPAGQHLAAWTGRDARGNVVAPGVYFVRATLEGREFTQRIVRVR